MKSELVFVHGRSQQRKDPAALKAEWVIAWKSGLEKSGLKLPINEEDIRFPYFGDTLFDLVDADSGHQAAEVLIKGDCTASPQQRDFIESVFNEILKKAIADNANTDVIPHGVLNWEWVQTVLKRIDRSVPYASGTSVALFTNDVFQYLTNIGIRDKIEMGVRKVLQADRPTVVVGHSLGSVVAYNVLRRDGGAQGWTVPLFVTVGSPLAATAIKNRLMPIEHPECVKNWFNALDMRDVVALYALDEQHFGIKTVENFDEVQNHTENRHGISGYLNDKTVAKRIYDAVVACE